MFWGPSPAAGTSAGRAQPGRRRREAGRRVSSRRLRRGPRPADADKAPGSRAPPPPASRPATQRHAHGPRPLRLSLVAPEATRLRPPPAATPPLPGRAGTRFGSPHLAARPDEGRAAPAGRDTCRGSLLAFHCCPSGPSWAERGPGQLSASPKRRCAGQHGAGESDAFSRDLQKRLLKPRIIAVRADPLGTSRSARQKRLSRGYFTVSQTALDCVSAREN